MGIPLQKSKNGDDEVFNNGIGYLISTPNFKAHDWMCTSQTNSNSSCNSNSSSSSISWFHNLCPSFVLWVRWYYLLNSMSNSDWCYMCFKQSLLEVAKKVPEFYFDYKLFIQNFIKSLLFIIIRQ